MQLRGAADDKNGNSVFRGAARRGFRRDDPETPPAA